MTINSAVEIDFADSGACAPSDKSPTVLKRFEGMAPVEVDAPVREEAHIVKWPWKKLAVLAAGPALSPSLTVPASESNKQLVRGRSGRIEPRRKEQRCLL
jgi:hypothetical protein